MLLQAVKGKTQLISQGGFGGGQTTKQGTFREAMDLKGAGGFSVIDGLVAIRNTLDWLFEKIGEMPPRKRDRYKSGCQAIKEHLDFEFGDSTIETPPALNFDALIVDFEHLAIELEDNHVFEPINMRELEEWEDTVTDLIYLIEQSDVGKEARSLLLDALNAIRIAIRNIRLYGSVAGAERLKDALGRLTLAEINIEKSNNDARKYLREGWREFLKILPYVEVVEKMKAIPEFLTSVRALGQ